MSTSYVAVQIVTHVLHCNFVACTWWNTANMQAINCRINICGNNISFFSTSSFASLSVEGVTKLLFPLQAAIIVIEWCNISVILSFHFALGLSQVVFTFSPHALYGIIELQGILSRLANHFTCCFNVAQNGFPTYIFPLMTEFHVLPLLITLMQDFHSPFNKLLAIL